MFSRSTRIYIYKTHWGIDASSQKAWDLLQQKQESSNFFSFWFFRWSFVCCSCRDGLLLLKRCNAHTGSPPCVPHWTWFHNASHMNYHLLYQCHWYTYMHPIYACLCRHFAFARSLIKPSIFFLLSRHWLLPALEMKYRYGYG